MTQELDHTALYALLGALGPDSADAAMAYENMRVRLIRFFRWNNCLFPEDLADTALDRLADNLARGREPILNLSRFVMGIARNLVMEQRATQMREKKMLSFLSWFYANRGMREEDKRMEDALSHCLARLSSQGRLLLERYYSGDAAERIRNRQALSAELSISVNALRNRALRLRAQLEICTTRHLAKTLQHDKSGKNVTTNRKRSYE